MKDTTPVTTVIVRRVKPGSEDAFQTWLDGIIAEAKRFPGHGGVTVLEPRPGGPNEFIVILRFSTVEASRRWVCSPERKRWLEKVEPLTLRTDQLEETGLETWFTLPDVPQPPHPPRYKMAFVTWLAIYPLLVLTFYAIGPLLTGIPAPGRIFVTTALLVPLMTWVVMPQMTKLFWGWIHPGVPRQPPVGSG